jgi:hypothetical protein
MATTTPASTSSFWHLRINLQLRNMVANHVTGSLMSLILILILPLYAPYFSLISYDMVFSLFLSSIYCFDFSPSVDSPIIFAMRLTLIIPSLSIDKMPQCTLANNCLTHPFMCFSRSKCDMSNKFMMSVLYSPRIHCAGSNSGVPGGPSPLLPRYLCVAKYGNFMVLETSWSEYLRISTPPTMLSLVFTPLGILDITIPSILCVCCTSCALILALTLFFPCGDDTPPSTMASFFVSCSGSGSRSCYVEPMASSTCRSPFTLDTSYFVCSASSSGCSATCAGSWSSSTCNVVCSYSGVWISSTSTTVGISFVPVLRHPSATPCASSDSSHRSNPQW